VKVLFKIGTITMTTGKLVVAVVVLICVPILVHWIWPGKVYNFLFERQGGVIFLGLIVGIFSGVVSAFLYSFLQKEVWQDDIKEMREKLFSIDTSLSEQLKKLLDDYDTLLKGIAPAIGGSFTQSLFEYHPMASREIARILSKQTNVQYERHHSRVIVRTASDNYIIKGLNKIGDSAVWLLDLHITWRWLNDSKITKYPLYDFLIVAVASAGALETLLAEIPSENRRDEAFKKRSDFLEKNNAKTIIVNPSDPDVPLSRADVDNMFSIVEVFVNGQPIEKSKLKPASEDSLPVGVYAAWSLPDPQSNSPLQVNDELTVEYKAHLCLVARREGEKTYWGEMSFSPSDVISGEYKLTLKCPKNLEFDSKQLSVDAVRERSGCRFIHEPLGNLPNIQSNGTNIHAEMKVAGPLTELHQISLTWKGVLN